MVMTSFQSILTALAVFVRCSIVFLLLVAAPSTAEVLSDRDNGPLSGLFGLPNSIEGATLLDAGQNAFDVSVRTSSHSNVDMVGDEMLIFDGETTRLGLRFRRGVGERLELGVIAEYVWHQSGTLDSLIEGWHGVFGLPDGDRRVRPEDALEIRFADARGTQLVLDNNTHGIGDLRLVAGWRLASGADRDTALRFGIKLPTGDGDELFGSSGVDVSLGLAGDHRRLAGNQKLTVFYRFDAVYLGEPDFLADRHESFVGQAAAGLGYRVLPAIELLVQGKWRSAIYDSAVDSVGDDALTLTFGGNLRLAERWTMSLAITEDLRVQSAPDVTFDLALRYRPGERTE